MGNKSSVYNKINEANINLSFLSNSLNIIKLKMGDQLVIPLNMIYNGKSNISAKDIDYACQSYSQINGESVVCKGLYNNESFGISAYFIIPKYHNERIEITKLIRGSTLLTTENEDLIFKYQTDVCHRIWSDLDTYYKMLSRIVNKKINGILLKEKDINAKKFKVIADFYTSGDDGRYLYELGNYIIMLPMMKSMILNRLNQESIYTRVNFDELKIKTIKNKKIEKGIKFTFICKIKSKTQN